MTHIIIFLYWSLKYFYITPLLFVAILFLSGWVPFCQILSLNSLAQCLIIWMSYSNSGFHWYFVLKFVIFSQS